MSPPPPHPPPPPPLRLGSHQKSQRRHSNAAAQPPPNLADEGPTLVGHRLSYANVSTTTTTTPVLCIVDNHQPSPLIAGGAGALPPQPPPRAHLQEGEEESSLPGLSFKPEDVGDSVLEKLSPTTTPEVKLTKAITLQNHDEPLSSLASSTTATLATPDPKFIPAILAAAMNTSPPLAAGPSKPPPPLVPPFENSRRLPGGAVVETMDTSPAPPPLASSIQPPAPTLAPRPFAGGFVETEPPSTATPVPSKSPTAMAAPSKPPPPTAAAPIVVETVQEVPKKMPAMAATAPILVETVGIHNEDDFISTLRNSNNNEKKPVADPTFAAMHENADWNDGRSSISSKESGYHHRPNNKSSQQHVFDMSQMQSDKHQQPRVVYKQSVRSNMQLNPSSVDHHTPNVEHHPAQPTPQALGDLFEHWGLPQGGVEPGVGSRNIPKPNAKPCHEGLTSVSQQGSGKSKTDPICIDDDEDDDDSSKPWYDTATCRKVGLAVVLLAAFLCIFGLATSRRPVKNATTETPRCEVGACMPGLRQENAIQEGNGAETVSTPWPNVLVAEKLAASCETTTDERQTGSCMSGLYQELQENKIQEGDGEEAVRTVWPKLEVQTAPEKETAAEPSPTSQAAAPKREQVDTSAIRNEHETPIQGADPNIPSLGPTPAQIDTPPPVPQETNVQGANPHPTSSMVNVVFSAPTTSVVDACIGSNDERKPPSFSPSPPTKNSSPATTMHMNEKTSSHEAPAEGKIHNDRARSRPPTADEDSSSIGAVGVLVGMVALVWYCGFYQGSSTPTTAAPGRPPVKSKDRLTNLLRFMKWWRKEGSLKRTGRRATGRRSIRSKNDALWCTIDTDKYIQLHTDDLETILRDGFGVTPRLDATKSRLIDQLLEEYEEFLRLLTRIKIAKILQEVHGYPANMEKKLKGEKLMREALEMAF